MVVDSPPGAGKSTLVVRAARALAETGEPLMIVAQTNEQVDDLVERLALEHPDLPIGRLSAGGYVTPGRILAHSNVSVAGKLPDLGDPAVVIATADKWAWIGDRTWPRAIVDEAYQMRSDKLLRIAALFERALFVGDPGQLDPFSIVDGDRWAGLSWDPVQSAVSVLLRHNPDLPVHRLPVSWRLPASAAPVVSEAFYPFTGFRAGTGHGDRSPGVHRRTACAPPTTGRWRRRPRRAGRCTSCPSRHTVRTDARGRTGRGRAGGAAAAAGAGRALRARQPPRHGRRGSPSAPPTATRSPRSGPPGCRQEITVDTANRLQGREYDVTIVLHPLSGPPRRHRLPPGVGPAVRAHLPAPPRVHRGRRAGIPELLDAHPSAEPVQLGVPVKFPDGWEANQAVLAHLSKHRVTPAG